MRDKVFENTFSSLPAFGRGKANPHARPEDTVIEDSKKLGRPKSEEKASAILDAAAHLFLERGVDGTSMDAIAERAGVSKQTVYSHYQSKESLFRSCIGGKLTQHQIAADDLPMTDNVAADLEELGRRYLHLLVDRDVIAMFRVIIAESVRHERIARLFQEVGPARTRAVIADYIQRRVQAGDLRAPNLDQAVDVFTSTVRGDFHMMQLLGDDPPGPGRIDQHVRQSVQHFLQAYAP
ncbi:MAG: TetR/AcrR family transcriptional regulator [Pseudomonadota bacterium]